MDLKPCDLILVHGKNNFISEAIEEITQSKYSHVAGVINKDSTLVEAEGFEKTGQVPLSKYTDYDVYRYEGLTESQKLEILGFINGRLGGHYNYFLLVIEFFRYVFHVTLPYKEPFGYTICSSLWVDAFRRVGIDLTPDVKYASPKDVSESKLLIKINYVN
jgi:cell wall-associated NlpC family hydrolase